jgi:hypothetical protein
VDVSSAELTAITPTEYRADVVVTLSVDDQPVLAVGVEVQLRTDTRKRKTRPPMWQTCTPGWAAL